MKPLRLTVITAILSLSTSLYAAQDGDKGYEMYNCKDIYFYSTSVYASAKRVHDLNGQTVDGYPTSYISRGFSGTGPHKMIPMTPGIEVYMGGQTCGYFLIVDSQGNPRGMIYRDGQKYENCEAYQDES
ncbi:putative candidate secreted effector protein [Blumeria hordei DH14]|uniref:Putative candidate secreted effector protein n=1 Tax=Blumeria graminis f. sp. hordei (strain DH14) TaxID=546991 RepID=N1JJH0_BLUG1|nr:putative candidate secreted effector protein [Blumeria hordei DH14]